MIGLRWAYFGLFWAALAELAEHAKRKREVAGSMPASSKRFSCVCVHQIDGLWHVHVQAYWSLSRVVYIQVHLYNMTLWIFNDLKTETHVIYSLFINYKLLLHI